MSGVKRRTKHRKQVQSDVLDSFHQPEENQLIVRIVQSHGSNILEVEAPGGDHGKCMLPTKYRKLIWVKRGDFLIVTQADGAYDTAASDKGGTVKYMVEHILTAQSIKKLKQDGLWPAEFETSLGSTAGVSAEGPDAGGQQILAPHESTDTDHVAAAGGGAAESKSAEGATDASGAEDAGNVLDGVFVNRNRRRVYVDSEDDSDSSSDDGE